MKKKTKPNENKMTKTLIQSAKHSVPLKSLRLKTDDEIGFRYPFIIKRGKGLFLYDYDDNRYADYQLSNGRLLAGHSNPQINKITKNSLSRGNCFLPYSKSFTNLANTIKEMIPFVEKVLVINEWSDIVEGLHHYIAENKEYSFFQFINPLEYLMNNEKYDIKKNEKAIYITDERFTFPSFSLNSWSSTIDFNPDLIVSWREYEQWISYFDFSR